jgi:effector-binding domain-containing protein
VGSKNSVSTELIFLPHEDDSTVLTWNGLEEANSNPFSRMSNFSWIKNINNDLHFLLSKIQSFYSNEDNVYGLHIQKDFVADSNFIFTSTTSANYPATDIIYKMIDRLRNYVSKNGAKETGYPMLNILKEGDAYVVKVALPIDERLADSGDIKYRWMLKGGNILVAEVKGGPHQIEKAFNEMADYVEDHGRVAPAIPFQSLITDRRQEPDTNKWVTKIYWPVM